MSTAVNIAPRAAAADVWSPLEWWHLLSLDAASVAVVWAIFFARCFDVPLPWTAPAALGLAVWMLYVLDRVADGANIATGGSDLAERHYFALRHRPALLGTVTGAAPLLVFLVILLPEKLRMGWVLLAFPLAGYIVAVHLLRFRRVPKEVLVGAFFAAGTMMPVLLSPVRCCRTTCVFAACGFGLLCWLNCTAIARWEGSSPSAMDAVSAACTRHFRTFAGVFILLAVISLTLASARVVAAPLSFACSALLLVWLDRQRLRLSRTSLRALADAALLTPMLVWPLVEHAGHVLR